MPPRRRRKRLLKAPLVSDDPRSIVAMRDEYLAWLAERQYSPRSVVAYGVYLEFFLRWCHERALLRPQEVTRPVLERYQRWLFHYRKSNGAPLSPISQSTRLVAVKGLFRFLARQHVILSNPAADLDMPKVPSRLPRDVLTDAEVERVMVQPPLGQLFGLRDRAILETFYSTGIRRQELAGLTVFDVQWGRGTLFVRKGKGAKDRYVPIGERALFWIRRYLTEVRPRIVMEPDPQTMFLGTRGEPLSLVWLTTMVGNYVKLAKVGKRGSCHLFRHTVATLMLERGADVRLIQEMLGHAHLGTTEIYTRVSIQHLKAIHTATHPAAAMPAEGTPEPNESVVEEPAAKEGCKRELK